MRKINLPSTDTISFTFDPREQQYSGIIMPDGTHQSTIGNLDPEYKKQLEVARFNGAQILWSTIYIEKIMDRIITNYFIGPFSGPSKKRDLFESELIKTSFLQFSTKKHLTEKISKILSVPKSHERDKLQGTLKSIMLWRNSFAHGTLVLDVKKGVILRYYSGGQKEDNLNDKYWETVESVFINCHQLLTQIENTTNK
jgi:hypothetical protein